MPAPSSICRGLFRSLSAILAFAPLCSGNLTAGTQPSSFKHITVNDGLSQSTVHSIMQDHMGFMWFGTSDGLNRYDGYTIVIYRHDDRDSASLDNSTVRTVYEDRTGTIWVGTDKGLNKFDRAHNRFVRYTTDDQNRINTGTIGIIDEDARGRLWIGASSGLYRFNPVRAAFIRYPYRKMPMDIYQNSITTFCRLRGSGTMLLGTVKGLKTADTLSRTIEDLEEYPEYSALSAAAANARISYIFEDHRGSIWVGSADGGLWKFDPRTNRCSSFMLLNSAQANRRLVISAIAEDSGGRVCVATYSDGYFVYDGTANTFAHIEHDSRDPSGLSFDLVSCFYLDPTGIFWIGTDGAGVDEVKSNAKPFHLYQTEPLNPNSLSGDFVKSLFEDREGFLWVGTVNAGLNRFDRRNNIWTHYLHDERREGSLSSNTVFSICEDPHGDIWIGTDKGLDCFSRRNETFGHFEAPAADPSHANDKSVRLLYLENESTLWVGTSDGLRKFDPLRREFAPGGFLTPVYEDIALTCALRGSRGTLWVSCESGGLLRCDPANNILENYDTLIATPVTVRSMVADSTGRLWLGTERGLLHYNPANHTFERFTESDGLPNNFIYGILKDAHENLWISTNKGISRFTPGNPPGKQFNNFDVADGLQGKEFNTGAYFENPTGEMLFGGVNGFNAFFPDSIRDNEHEPEVVVTSVRKFDDVAANEGSLEKNNVVSVEQKDNVITFEFVALEYTNPAQNQYKFMLENFDTHWSAPGMQRFARYTNLDAGEYVFRVLGSNNDGVWNETGATVRLTVVPPFWRTWWFMSAAFFALLASVAAAAKLVTTRKLQRQLERLEAERALLNERSRISKDMHDEIGSNLTKIAILSEIVQKNIGHPDQVGSSLTGISDSARAVIDNMSQIIWAIDPRNDRLDNLAAYIREFASEYFELANIRCRFDIPRDLSERKLSAEVRRNIFLTVKEAVNNIVKHSAATDVYILLRISPDRFEITLSDNGKGFDPASLGTTRSGGNGLHNMAKRIHDIGGSYSLVSHPGTGTTITLSV